MFYFLVLSCWVSSSFSAARRGTTATTTKTIGVRLGSSSIHDLYRWTIRKRQFTNSKRWLHEDPKNLVYEYEKTLYIRIHYDMFSQHWLRYTVYRSFKSTVQIPIFIRTFFDWFFFLFHFCEWCIWSVKYFCFLYAEKKLKYVIGIFVFHLILFFSFEIQTSRYQTIKRIKPKTQYAPSNASTNAKYHLIRYDDINDIMIVGNWSVKRVVSNDLKMVDQ